MHKRATIRKIKSEMIIIICIIIIYHNNIPSPSIMYAYIILGVTAKKLPY